MKIYCGKHREQSIRFNFIGYHDGEMICILDDTCPLCLKEEAAATRDSLKFASDPDPGRWDPESL